MANSLRHEARPARIEIDLLESVAFVFPTCQKTETFIDSSLEVKDGSRRRDQA